MRINVAVLITMVAMVLFVAIIMANLIGRLNIMPGSKIAHIGLSFENWINAEDFHTPGKITFNQSAVAILRIGAIMILIIALVTVFCRTEITLPLKIPFIK